jgi:hypothetical protein
MSAFTVIQDVSTLLRDQLASALAESQGVDFGVVDANGVVLSPPGEAAEGSLASLYLYHVELERHLRNQRPLPSREDPARLRRPPLMLQLRYLLTPASDEETSNQLLLGRVLQYLHDQPVLPAPGEEPRDSFGGASPDLRVRMDTPAIEQLTQLWNAFNQPFRMSIALLVDVVAIDSARPPELAPRVDAVHAVVGSMERQ